MSLPCLESTGGHSRFTSLDKHISSQSAKSGSRTRHSAPGVQLLRIQICSPTFCYLGGIPFAQAHTLPSFSLKGGKNGKAGFGGCFFSFCFEILAVKPGWPMVCAKLTAVAPYRAHLSSECFSTRGTGFRPICHSLFLCESS